MACVILVTSSCSHKSCDLYWFSARSNISNTDWQWILNYILTYIVLVIQDSLPVRIEMLALYSHHCHSLLEILVLYSHLMCVIQYSEQVCIDKVGLLNKSALNWLFLYWHWYRFSVSCIGPRRYGYRGQYRKPWIYTSANTETASW